MEFRRVLFRSIDEIGRQQHARIGEAQIDRDAAGKRAGISADQYLAVDIAGHRGQLDAPETPFDHIVEDHRVVGEILVEQQELLALVEDHRLPSARRGRVGIGRSEEHTSELQSLMRISYAVFCLKKKKIIPTSTTSTT